MFLLRTQSYVVYYQDFQSVQVYAKLMAYAIAFINLWLGRDPLDDETISFSICD